MIGHVLLGFIVGLLAAAAAGAFLEATAMGALVLHVAAGGAATLLSALATVGRGHARRLPPGGAGTGRVIPLRSPPAR